VLLASLAGWYIYLFFWPQHDTRLAIPYSEVLVTTQSDLVKSVSIQGQSLDGEFKQELRWTGEKVLAPDEPVPADVKAEDVKPITKFESTIPLNSQEQLLPLLQEHDVTVTAKRESQSILPTLLISVLPLLLFVGLIVLMGRNMTRGQQNVFGFGRSRAKVYDAERPHVPARTKPSASWPRSSTSSRTR
jgi:cell division protease FtsH